jgi:hypothetical protein
MSEHFAARAVEIALLERTSTERAAAEAHITTCPSCARALADAVELTALLGELPPHPPAAPHLAVRVKAAIARDDAVSRAGWKAATLAVPVVWGVFVAIAKHRLSEPRAWLESAVALGVALLSALLARGGKSRAATAGAVASSALLVLVAAAGGALFARLGVKCLAIELLCAALPFGCLAYAYVWRRASAAPLELAALAASGALAGHAALHLSCTAQTDTPHLLVFHFGAVLVAAALAALAARPIARRA